MDKKNSVLIVDDDTLNLMDLGNILGSDYKVYAITDGISAVEKAKKSLPDLILLDIIMPGMNGYEVLAELQKSEITQNIPVIFITGLDNSSDEEKGLYLGAVDYIYKPFNKVIVKRRVLNQIKIVNLQKALDASKSGNPIIV